MTIKEALLWAARRLKAEDTAEPKGSSEVLLGDVLGLSRTELLTNPDQKIKASQRIKYELYIQRRVQHEPVWQIIGKVDFWGMSYKIDKNVLVPRPETEILVTEVLKFATTYSPRPTPYKILDLGTGSGTIIIALAHELEKQAHNLHPITYDLFASDISPRALQIAKKNTTNLLSSRQVAFKKGSLLEPWVGERFDIICANLPYIPHEDMDSLAFDVLHHEPRLALDGGAAGLELYEKFFKEVGLHLCPGGAIFCEIGIKQGEQIKKLAKKYLPKSRVRVLGDLAGIDRVAIIKIGE
jgi:release factor glutamine methyltransferase